IPKPSTTPKVSAKVREVKAAAAKVAEPKSVLLKSKIVEKTPFGTPKAQAASKAKEGESDKEGKDAGVVPFPAITPLAKKAVTELKDKPPVPGFGTPKPPSSASSSLAKSSASATKEAPAPVQVPPVTPAFKFGTPKEDGVDSTEQKVPQTVSFKFGTLAEKKDKDMEIFPQLTPAAKQIAPVPTPSPKPAVATSNDVLSKVKAEFESTLPKFDFNSTLTYPTPITPIPQTSTEGALPTFTWQTAAKDSFGIVQAWKSGKLKLKVDSKKAPEGFNWTAAGISKPATTTGSWECGVCMISNKPEAVKCAACETDKPGVKPPAAPPTSAGSFGGFKLPTTSGSVGQWECGTCLIKNKADASTCAACETPKPGSAAPPPSAGGFKFAPAAKPAGQWECGTCLINNKPDATICAACETPKPGSSAPKLAPTTGFQFKPPSSSSTVSFGSSSPAGFGTSTGGGFKPPSGMTGGVTFGSKPADSPAVPSVGFGASKPVGQWECGTCLIKNKVDATICAACETPKPGSSSSSSASAQPSFGGFKPPSSTASDASVGGFKFAQTAKPPGQWDCGTCLINNKADATVCAACETPKPGSTSSSSATAPPSFGGFKPPSTTSEATVSGFKFAPTAKPAGQWECGTCLINNKGDATICAACETPKPGSSSSSSASAQPSFGGFKPPSSTASDASIGGFKFAPTAKPAGQWECGTCLINNKADATVCAACETPKPGSTSSSSTATPPSFGGFKPPAPTTSSTGFQFAPPSSGGFSFGGKLVTGDSSVASTSGSSSTPSFQFGGKPVGGSVSSTPSALSSGTGFSFNPTPAGASFGSSTSSTGGFSFKSASEDSQSNAGTTGSGAPAVSFGDLNKPPRVEFGSLAGSSSSSGTTTFGGFGGFGTLNSSSSSALAPSFGFGSATPSFGFGAASSSTAAAPGVPSDSLGFSFGIKKSTDDEGSN
ncbi:E3 SUMO-protein ligase RanBP2, partial [Chytridiales sp. JEL 0842]